MPHREELWFGWWSFALYDLHLTQDQFYSLTLRQLDALRKRHDLKTEHDEYMLAQLTSYVVNFSYRSPEKPSRPGDFMLCKATTKPTKKPSLKQRKKAAAESLRLFFPRK